MKLDSVFSFLFVDFDVFSSLELVTESFIYYLLLKYLLIAKWNSKKNAASLAYIWTSSLLSRYFFPLILPNF